jgi:hypothetical protein
MALTAALQVVWCGVGVGWRGVVWCGVVWYGVAWRGVVWPVSWQCGGVVWCGMARVVAVRWRGVAWRCPACGRVACCIAQAQHICCVHWMGGRSTNRPTDRQTMAVLLAPDNQH